MRDSLEEKLDFETKSRIVGCKKQLESLSFLYELNLGQKLYVHTDNLSRTLQQKKMLRWLKTWLRSTMTQKRFNALSLIHKNQENVDEMSLIDVANKFVNLHSANLNIFGKSTCKDLRLRAHDRKDQPIR